MSDINPEIEAEEDSPQESRRSVWPSPGQKLKKLREEMGLSHARVADALHMTAHYVKALESDEYNKLPGKTFVKGYFRAYAKLLGADVEDIMQSYAQYVSALEESQESHASVIRARKAYDQNVRWMICAAIIIVVVVGVSWWLARTENTEAAVSSNNNGAVAEVSVIQSTLPTAEALVAALDVNANTAGKTDTVQALEAESSAVIPAVVDALAEAADTQTGNPALLGVQERVQERVQESTQESVEAGVVAQPEAAADFRPENDLAVDAVTENTGAAEELEEAEEDRTVTSPGLPEYTVTRLDNRREVALESEGSDVLTVHFSGASWIEVDNGDNTRLYHDMLNNGDDLSIRGKAPFNVLFGDASVVDVTFNARSVDLSARIRSDKSARIILAPETN